MVDTKPSFETEAYVPDRLIAGHADLITDQKTILSGEGVLVRGALLGRVTASGKYRLSLTASNDGSQTPVAILAEDVDATADDAEAPAYEAGEFNSNAMTFGTGHTAASVRDELTARGIYLKAAVPA